MIDDGTTNQVDATPVQFNQLLYFEQDATLTELLVTAGASVYYETGTWEMFAGLDLHLIEDVDLGGKLRVGDGSHSLKAERSNPIGLVGGVSTEALGARWFAEATLVNSTSLRVGAVWKF